MDANGVSLSTMGYKPFGETRMGTTSTDRRFTGQREESSLGSLYDYGARFYSPAIGRFISADTIVPSAGDPQNLNRFSYVSNNPIKRIDPSGHVPCDGENSGFVCTQATPKEKRQADFDQAVIDACNDPSLQCYPSLQRDILQPLDQLAYHALPSVVGIQVVGCFDGDMGIGADTCGTLQFVWNWRSGEFGMFLVPSINGRIGTPNGASLSGGGGLILSYGASSLERYGGESQFGGMELGVDVETGASLTVQKSTTVEWYDSNNDGIRDTPRPVTEPKSGMEITTWSGSVQAGLNAIPTILDANAKVGGTAFAHPCTISFSPFTISCQ